MRRNAMPSARAAAVLSAWLVACGGGADLLIPEPPAATGSAVASGASPVAAGCTGGRVGGTVFVNAEVEPFVAASPLDPDLLLGAWQQDRNSNGGARALVSAVSRDGGRSWERTLQPLSRCGGAAAGSAGDFQGASDPWVDIGPGGTLHLMGLGFSGAILQAGSASAMLALRSTDGGRSWSAPQVLQRDGATRFNDKNTLTADPTDARLVYAVWDRLEASGRGPTLLARSQDDGASWEPAREIVDPTVAGGVSQTLGNRIVVIADGPERGTLVNVFTQIDTVDNRSASSVRVARSTDHGQTWEPPVTVADLQSVGTRNPETGGGVRDGGIIPTLATGPGGTLWLAWQDARFSGGARDAIALSKSGDGGRSWSAPVAVNRDAGVAAFTPTLHVRADGTLQLMHFDLRSNTADRNTLLADLWLLSSRDGVTWAELPLARGFDLEQAPLSTSGRFLGDYQGLVSTRGLVLPFVALPLADGDNRSDVVAMRVDAAAALLAQAQHKARGTAAPVRDAAEFARARSEAIARAMEQRVPGWRALMDRSGRSP